MYLFRATRILSENTVQACLHTGFSDKIHVARAPQSQTGALKERRTAQLDGLRSVALNRYPP